jgi:hypothetical protein
VEFSGSNIPRGVASMFQASCEDFCKIDEPLQRTTIGQINVVVECADNVGSITTLGETLEDRKQINLRYLAGRSVAQVHVDFVCHSRP